MGNLITTLGIAGIFFVLSLQRSKRIEEEIELLQHKLKNTEEAIAFGGKNIKIVRSQGKKHEITFVKELSRWTFADIHSCSSFLSLLNGSFQLI